MKGETFWYDLQFQGLNHALLPSCAKTAPTMSWSRGTARSQHLMFGVTALFTDQLLHLFV